MDPVFDPLVAPSPSSPTEDVRLKAWAIEAAVEREEAADEARDPPPEPVRRTRPAFADFTAPCCSVVQCSLRTGDWSPLAM